MTAITGKPCNPWQLCCYQNDAWELTEFWYLREHCTFPQQGYRRTGKQRSNHSYCWVLVLLVLADCLKKYTHKWQTVIAKGISTTHWSRNKTSLFPFHKLFPATCDLLHGIAKLGECHLNCCYNLIVTRIFACYHARRCANWQKWSYTAQSTTPRFPGVHAIFNVYSFPMWGLVPRLSGQSTHVALLISP